MAKYKTQQGELIMEYMRSRAGTHVTVNEIMSYFQNLKVEVGLTTIYRHLNRLVDRGLVKKFYIDDKSAACFEYIQNKDAAEKLVQQFHLKCITCDQLVHFECHEIADWQRHIEEDHKFEIDPARTVFYGTCEKCKN